MTFYAFGDSFTWGSDMSDTMRDFEYNVQPEEFKLANPFNELYSRHTWQAKVADYLKQDYKCLAVQGCSNQSMVRRFFEYAPLFTSADMVSVNFTWRDRYDFYDYVNKEWTTVRPSGTTGEYTAFYYRFMHSIHWANVESLKAINLIIQHLLYHEIPFIATCIDEEIYAETNKPLEQNLQAISKKYITWFEGQGFYHWSKDKGFPVSPMWHPLEEAHEAAFELMKENLR